MFQRDQNQEAGPSAAGAAPGNRPAQNARQVEGAVPVAQDWRGGDHAADFLGLDQDLQGAGAQGARPGPGGGPESWLLGLDETAPPPAGAPVATPQGFHVPPAPSAYAPAADDDGDGSQPLALEASYAEAAPRRRLSSWAMPAIAATTLIGVGIAVYLVYSLPKPGPEAPSTALAPTARPEPRSGARAPKPVGDEVARATTPDAAGPTSATAPTGLDLGGGPARAEGPIDRSRPADDAAPEPLELETAGPDPEAAPRPDALPAGPEADARPASERFEAWLRAHGRTAAPGADVDGTHAWMSRASEDVSAHLPHAAGSPFLSGSLPGGALTRRPGGAPDPGTPLPAKNGVRRATAADLAGLWQGPVVPIEAIASRTRLLTPDVGRVRVILKGGEIFEGRLYAVGDGKVWVESGSGRLALLGDQVRKIEQIASAEGDPSLGGPGSHDLTGLPRVRVRTPGGMFYGKVIARDEATVTLITEEGAKVTLESIEVEDAPIGKTSIVRLEEPQ